VYNDVLTTVPSDEGSSYAAHFGHLAHFFGEKYPENYAEILAHLHVLGGALRPQRSFPGRCAQLLIGRENMARRPKTLATGSFSTLGSSTQSFGREQAIPARYSTAVGNYQYHKTVGPSQASARGILSSGPSARSMYAASQAEPVQTVETDKTTSRSTRTDSSSTRKSQAPMDDSASIDDHDYHDYHEHSASRLFVERVPSQTIYADKGSQSSGIREYATKPTFSGRHDDSSDEDSDPRSNTHGQENNSDSCYFTDGAAKEANYDSGNDAYEADVT
jgi:hypothetical protein